MPRAKPRPTSEPAIPPQPLPEPVLPPGQQAIPLHKRVGGSNRHPSTLRFTVVAFAIVDEADYAQFSQFRWSAQWNEHRRSYVPTRTETVGGKTIHILLAREILGLPRNPGRGTDEQADHIDNNPLNNLRSNLRATTLAQNVANQRRRRNATLRFRGVQPNGNGYHPQFTHNTKMYYLPTVPLETEAAFMFNHAVTLLRDPLAQRNDIPPDELLAPARQLELIALVETKLRSLKLIV